ncbi:MAG: spore coat protein [Hyphomicrobiales bacterium]|nr:MAG: spore coat protein [Hyphomicrobiales bacterium]
MRKLWTLSLAAVAVLTASSAAFACDDWDGDYGRRGYRSSYSYGPVGYYGYSSYYGDDDDYGYGYGPGIYASIGFYDGWGGGRGGWRGGYRHAGGGGHHRR